MRQPQKARLHEIAQVDVDRRCEDRQDHQREADHHEADERHGDAPLRRHARDDDVRGRTDDRAVAAEAGAEREAPPDRLKIRDAHRPHVLNQRNHRRNERNVVEERRNDRTHPQDEHRRLRHVTAREIDAMHRKIADDARLHEAADGDEETDEEEDRRPLDAVHRVLDELFLADQKEQEERARNRDERRLKTRERMEEEHQDDQSENEQTLPEKRDVFELVPFILLHHESLELRLRRQMLAVEQDEDRRDDDEVDDRDDREVLNERRERQLLDGAADHDVRRIADERRRAADVRRDDLRQKIRHDIDMELRRDAERDRHHQENRRHVVKERRANGRDQRQVDQEIHGIGLRLLRRPDSNKIEESRLARDGDDDHHADQKPERVEVDVVDGGLLRHDAHDDHEDCADHRNDRAVDLLRDDHRIHRDEDDTSYCFLFHKNLLEFDCLPGSLLHLLSAFPRQAGEAGKRRTADRKIDGALG